MRLELEPPVGVAGIRVGSTMREAHQRMQSLRGLVAFDGILARYQSDLFVRAFPRGGRRESIAIRISPRAPFRSC